MSELSYIVGHPAGVAELLGVGTKPHTHIGVRSAVSVVVVGK